MIGNRERDIFGGGEGDLGNWGDRELLCLSISIVWSAVLHGKEMLTK